jgi:hypothetical protein
MNTASCTGYLVKDASVAYTPKGERKLVFETFIRADGDTTATPWHCEMADSPQLDLLAPLLTPGQGVTLEAQIAGRPFVKDGRQVGYNRFLRITKITPAKVPQIAEPAETF